MTERATLNVTRRNFVIGALGSLTVPVILENFDIQTVGSAEAAGSSTAINAYISIDATNQVTLTVAKAEMGQGIHSGLAQIVAEELNLSWDQISVVHADFSTASVNTVFSGATTGGSSSIRNMYTPFRTGAAIARDILIAAAEATYPNTKGTWKLGTGGTLTSGLVANPVPFSSLLAAALNVTKPTTATLKPVANFTKIGQRLTRLDLPAKINGSAMFCADIKIPGMVYAYTVHSPVFGSTATAVPASVPGATAVINLGKSVAFVAENTWKAKTAAETNAGAITWSTPSKSTLNTWDTDLIKSNMANLAQSPTVTIASTFDLVGLDASTVIANAPVKIDTVYETPFLAHGTLETLSCVASVTSTSCEVWIPTQEPQKWISKIATAAGVLDSQVLIHTTLLGGSFGRKSLSDYVEEAVKISKAVGKPVKLMWGRVRDLQGDAFRPAVTYRMQMSADATGKMTGLASRLVVLSSGPNGISAPVYSIPNRKGETVKGSSAITTGPWRSVEYSNNTFAMESAVDELARAANIDPLTFRLNNLTSGSRAWTVLNEVAKLSKWFSQPATDPASSRRKRAMGVAVYSGFSSFGALVMEVGLNADNSMRVLRAFFAADCGTIINPDSVEAQIEGAISFSLGAALWGQAKFLQGVPQFSTYKTYRMMKLADMPDIRIKLVSSTAAPTGSGELATPLVAPALANAWAQLTGKRVRSLPFFPEQNQMVTLDDLQPSKPL